MKAEGVEGGRPTGKFQSAARLRSLLFKQDRHFVAWEIQDLRFVGE